MSRLDEGYHASDGDQIAMRMQFYAIEIARYGGTILMLVRNTHLTSDRNREGLNDWIYEREHPDEGKAPS